MKITGAAIGALLVSMGLQNATTRNIKAEYVPGAGHPPGGRNSKSKEKYNDRVNSIDVSKLSAGIYVLHITTNDNQLLQQRFAKE